MTDRGTPGPTGSPTAQVRVWDIFVRFSHWTVAAAFFIAFFTEDDVLTLHVWAGYTVGILVVLRVLWGFVGPSHARFMDFVYRPATVWRYAVNLLAFRARRYVGHSPAGGAIVVTLLLGLLATVWSGLELYAVERGAGPLAGAWSLTAHRTPRAAAPPVQLNDREGTGSRPKREDNVWEDVHEVLAELLFALVVAHLAGVLWASVAHRENLVRSMITGMKRPPD